MFQPLECTTLLPELTSVDTNTQLLLKLVERPDVTQKHFQCLLLDLTRKSPVSSFDASGISLSQVLKKGVKDDRLLKALFDMKMKANEKDIQMAIRVLPDTRVTTLKLILCNATVDCTSVNTLCRETMDGKKQKFTALLIEKGATPPCDELIRLYGWPEAELEPAIANYLAAKESSKSRASSYWGKSPTDDTVNSQQSSTAQAQVVEHM